MASLVTFAAPATCSMDREIVSADQYLAKLQSTISRVDASAIDAMAHTLFEAYSAERTIFIVGNGGSAALASHFACDLGKGVSFNNGGKRVRALALTDNIPLITAWANDVSYEYVFAEQLRNFVAAGDVVFAISGSGNSLNVLRALELARSVHATTLGVTGFNGGKMKALCDLCLVVPCDNMQVIEDLHTVTAHALSTLLYNMVAEAHGSKTARNAA
jgi:D-sedoheptulose 7-phosphate isomerase